MAYVLRLNKCFLTLTGILVISINVSLAVLLILVSQRVEIPFLDNDSSAFVKDSRTELRGAPATSIEWMILAYVIGLIWTEIKQLWDEGADEYCHDMWNILDFVTNSLYIATLTLRVIAYLQVIML